MTTPDPLRAALTLSPTFGAGLWLGDRLVARISATVDDSRVTPEEPEPRWKRDAMVFVDAVNAALARVGHSVQDVQDGCDWVYAPGLGFYCHTHKEVSMTEPPTHGDDSKACPVCGTPGRIMSSDEGTTSFAAALWRTALVAEPGLRVAAQRREDAEEAIADYEARLHEAWSETGEQPSDEQEAERGHLAHELAEAILALRACLTLADLPITETKP